MDYSWIADDPYRSFFGHPYLPAGYDSMAIGAEEVNAPGENWSVWSVYYDTFVGFHAVIITDAMMEVFVSGCPDYVTAPDIWALTITPIDQTITIKTDYWGEQTVPTQNNVITFPHEAQTLEVRKTG